MRALTEYILAVSDLVEAEVKAIRQGLFRLVLAAALVLGGAVLALMGLAMVLYGLYQLLMSAGLGGSAAAALSGSTFIAVAALMIGGASWLKR